MAGILLFNRPARVVERDERPPVPFSPVPFPGESRGGRLRIRARDLAAARRFYAAAVRPLGLDVIETGSDAFVLGSVDSPALEVEADHGFEGEFDAQPETRPAHVAIEAPDGYSVRAFYRAALEAGGRQIGYPAPQPTDGHGSYYCAKVIDPDGNCIECGWRH